MKTWMDEVAWITKIMYIYPILNIDIFSSYANTEKKIEIVNKKIIRVCFTRKYYLVFLHQNVMFNSMCYMPFICNLV